MLFNSLEYAYLLIGSVFAYWLAAEHRQLRIVLLLIASYFFYASWNAKYLALIFMSSSLDYFVGKLLAQEAKPAKRKALLAVSATINLGILATFKYFNFFSHEIARALSFAGLETSPAHLDVLLPVGISFYTFQTLSYTIDIYRDKLTPARSYTQYLLYVSFFPQLVAGPIVRARDLLPQLERRPSLTSFEGSQALWRIGVGLAKKAIIADYLGAHIVDPVFGNPQMYSSLETLVAVYAYAFQIYADFSAYSDIAIGSAMLLGIKIPENFNAPYRAANLREFWERWHISLSTWLRDYLYIPLGGSRKGRVRTYVNLMITMLLGGLWHGAAMTFVVWGAIHGCALVVTRFLQRAADKHRIPSSIRKPVGVFLTFHVVVAAWVFFRARTFDNAFEVFGSLFSGTFDTANIPTSVIGVLVLAALSHWFPDRWLASAVRLYHSIPSVAQAAVLVAIVFVANFIARTEVQPFIYFQF